MAKVLDQGILPINEQISLLVPNLDKLSGKMLAELPCFFNAFLATNSFDLQQDQYGNPFVVFENSRLSLAVAIVSNSKLVAYKRTGNEQNFNEGTDIIGSVGYAIPGIFFKVSQDFWNVKVLKAILCKNLAWEKTDGVNDLENILMPVILLEVDDARLILVEPCDIQEPTAKMACVIKELEKQKIN